MGLGFPQAPDISMSAWVQHTYYYLITSLYIRYIDLNWPVAAMPPVESTTNSGHLEKLMYIDPDDVFREIEKRRADGTLPSGVFKKIDYDKQAKEVLHRLKQSLGCADLSDEEFFSLYQKATDGQERSPHQADNHVR